MMLILGSAPLLAASIYMVLGRFISGLNAEKYAVLSPRKVTFLYVFIDVVSFVCQILGSAAQASGEEGARKGMRVIVGGLAFQLVACLGFIAMSATLHVRLNREPTATSSRPHVYWRKHMKTLYTVSLLLTIRSLYRFIEFAERAGGSTHNKEALLYVFDALSLFATAVCLALVHPGMLLRSIRKAECKPLPDDSPLAPLRGLKR
ncbi:hypothetical protein PMIN05_008673 [Paraphaeosphaeria minitans]